ncbi:MAG TPA: GNAT family N-acetyltransferase [Clostridia bacterium]|nr:GNAT family N-acetyltransferase [Clostridia bacterium]
MLQIRKIRPEDIDFILELTKDFECSRVKLLPNIENFLVCENDNIKCGCGCLIPLDSTGLISWVTVKESYRREKLGSAITKALLNIAELKGIKEVYAAGICGDFLTAMGFVKYESKAASEDMREILGDIDGDCYKVTLEGYFKPCSHK